VGPLSVQQWLHIQRTSTAAHYHTAANHQGTGNRLLEPLVGHSSNDEPLHRGDPLGAMFNFSCHAAA
jgi:hypothetical protein